MTTLDTVRAELGAYDVSRPRSRQRESGASQTFSCRAESVLRLCGVEQSDPRLSWPAIVGSALHAAVEAAAGPGVLTEHRGTYRGIGCTVDRYDPATATLTDYKSLADAGAVAVMQRTGPKRAQLAQINLGAAALIEAGHDVQTVELLYLPRNGTLDDAWLWTGRFDRALADEAAEWLLAEWTRAAELKPAVDAGDLTVLDGLRDEFPSFCRSYCPYVTTCRGPEVEGEQLDGHAAELAAAYADARQRADQAEQEKKALRGELDGISGQAGPWRITWAGGKTKTVTEVDDEQVRADYQAMLGNLPTRTVEKTSALSLRVTKADPE